MIARVLVLSMLIASCGYAEAGVSISSAPAVRAAALSAPALERPADMSLHAGDTADQAIHATDVDGDPLTFSVNAGPSYMTVTTIDPGTGSATGNIHLAPSSQGGGTASGIVAVYDGVNYRIASLGIQVFPYLEPVPTLTVIEGAVLDVPLTAHDPGHVVTFVALGDLPFATATPTSDSTAILHLAPGFADAGNYFSSITVSDGAAAFSLPVRVMVGNVIRPPVLAQPSDMHVIPGTITEQALSATDPEGLALSFYKASGPDYMSAGTLSAIPGRGYVRFEPPADADTASIAVAVGVTNGGATDEQSFLVRSDLLNQPPTLSLRDVSMVEGAEVRDTVVAVDPDGQRLTLSTSPLPPFMTFTPQEQTLAADSIRALMHFAPGFEDAGSYSVAVRVSDGRDEDIDTLHVVVRDAGNAVTGLLMTRFDDFAVAYDEYSAVDGTYRMAPRKNGALAFEFADTLGSGARWSFVFPSTVTEGEYTTADPGVFFDISGEDTTVHFLYPCTPRTTSFQIRRITRSSNGSIVSFWASFSTGCSQGYGLNGELRYRVTGLPLTIVAPNWIAASTGQALTFTVTAYDSMGPATSLSAGGPSGSTFVSTGAGTGVFSWTPPRLAAGNYFMSFEAFKGSAAAEFFTEIHVVSVDRAPRAFANGPYFGKVAVPIQFSGTGSSDPENDALTYRWTFGDGGVGTGAAPSHAYAAPGPYSITLIVSDGLLTGGDVTLATVYWPDSARAAPLFGAARSRTIHLGAGDGHLCVALETVDVPSTIVEIDPFTVRMIAKGMGTTEVAPADPSSLVLGDADGNGIPDVTACFGSEGLRPLFSLVSGTTHVVTSMEFALRNGHVFHATLPLDVEGSEGVLRPLLAPNPLRPSGTLSFFTRSSGAAKLTLFDSRGRRVRTVLDVPSLPTGYHDVPVDTQDDEGRSLPSGVYYYRLETSAGIRSGRLTLLR